MTIRKQYLQTSKKLYFCLKNLCKAEKKKTKSQNEEESWA